MDKKCKRVFVPGRISIITAVMNGERYFEQSIQSVFGQTYSNKEYVVIDGGSTDGTVEILEKYQDAIDYLVSEPDRGIYHAWNKGVALATGEWLCFIGSDDMFCSIDVLDNIAPHLFSNLHNNKKYVYNSNIIVSRDSLKMMQVKGKSWDQCRQHFGVMMSIPHCGAFHHYSFFVDHGGFDESFRIAGDYEYLLREYTINPDFAMFVNIPGIVMRDGGLSTDKGNFIVMMKEIERCRRMHNQRGTSLQKMVWQAKVIGYTFFKTLFGYTMADHIADFYRLLSRKNKRWTRI